MALTRIPHDEFFKRSMADLSIAKDFFTAHLPATVLSQVCLDTLHMEPSVFVDEELKSRLNDMLYRVKLYNKEDDAYLYLLIDHQSTPDPIMPFRLTYYMMQVLDKHVRDAKSKKKDPLPLPFIWSAVFYNGQSIYDKERCLFKLFGEYGSFAEKLFTEAFNLIDVSLEADADLRGQRWASVLSWCMRHSRHQEFLPYIPVLGALLRDLAVKVGDSRFKSMLYYVASSLETSASKDTVIKALLKELPAEFKGEVMTLGEQIYAEGELKGELRGELRGELKGVAIGVDHSIHALEMLKADCHINDIVKETELSYDVIERLRQTLIN
jgi:predicted transposase YdaD